MAISDLVSTAYNKLLFLPIFNLLIFFYHFLGDNLGWAIIGMTIFLRIIMYPLTNKQIDATRKQKALQPELAKLKQKYKNKEVYSKKQMELMREHGVNPAVGCVTMIIPLIIIIPLYQVFTYLLETAGQSINSINELLYFDFLKFPEGATLNVQFLYLDLSKPDPYFILPILAAASQFFLSKYMTGTTKQAKELAKGTPEKTDDMMANMQNQMTYIMPIITLVIGFRLPAGLILYWFVSTVAILAQYVYINKKNDRLESTPKKAKEVKDKSNTPTEVIEGEFEDTEITTESSDSTDSSKKKKKKKKKKK